jgi:hypothetical protein
VTAAVITAARGPLSSVQFQLQAAMYTAANGVTWWYALRTGVYRDLHVDRRWLAGADQPLQLRIVVVS